MNIRKITPSDRLLAIEVPGDNASWPEITTFASTFDPAEFDFHNLVTFEIPLLDEEETLSEMRARLYYQWRKWNHFGRQPDNKCFNEIKILIYKIRRSAL